mgnify:CR=1 FL=1
MILTELSREISIKTKHHIKKRIPHINRKHINENTSAVTQYTSTDGTVHDIRFENLLKEGYNMDKFIKDNTLFKRPDHNFSQLARLLKKDSIVYDLGSYIGTFAIPMAIEGMKIYTFEAWPDNHTRCSINCKPYDIQNFSVALSDKNETKKTQITNCQGWANFDENHFEEIRHVRLDDFMIEKNLPNPSLVKMDIEGMESIALHGMTNLLENIRPIWSVGHHFKMPAEIEGIAWVDVEDGGFDFAKIGNELDYAIYDEVGLRASPEILQQTGGEFIFIPKEKIKYV